jgi:hypothetical protein
MDEIFWPNRKVCDYTFNFMAMSCLWWLTIFWYLSQTIRLFLLTCVHYNYKWIANPIVDFQFSFNVILIMLLTKTQEWNRLVIFTSWCNLALIDCFFKSMIGVCFWQVDTTWCLLVDFYLSQCWNYETFCKFVYALFIYYTQHTPFM